ncbi:peptide deformylase [Gymnodinialimonas ceratoperidinii]|uniref:Peptide deformylase n=1 Tax=Gymnodinialimonas ceratoperidinii TaxID=2856823 RepID=A0A8F6TVL4_9RHOB|nr:peptide deformylase [Gymnodinialimonas ceratoperidinii]QXT39761.1 peptide deformylase [Gymnodinialimonas ceratoperidinii]
MSVRPVLLWPDPRLSQVCAPVDGPVAGLVDDLFDTMYAAKGRGLAAPQIGVLARVFVVDVTWKEAAPTPLAFINPEIVSSSAETSVMEEQCLSIPDLPMAVSRPETVTLRWDTAEGTRREETFSGALARCIQHEQDHLDGRVIFDHQSPERRAELEAAYAG